MTLTPHVSLMLLCCQASSPWWSSLSCASWCLWCGTCSATKAPTTPTRPRAQTRQTAQMQRSSSATQPSPKPSRRARRSGSSDWLAAAEAGPRWDERGRGKPTGRVWNLSGAAHSKTLRTSELVDSAAWVWKHRVPSRFISALFPVDARKQTTDRCLKRNVRLMCFIWRDFCQWLYFLFILFIYLFIYLFIFVCLHLTW